MKPAIYFLKEKNLEESQGRILYTKTQFFK